MRHSGVISKDEMCVCVQNRMNWLLFENKTKRCTHTHAQIEKNKTKKQQNDKLNDAKVFHSI